MRAIEFQLSSTKLIEVRFGESQFKLRDEFWYDFTPDGGEKTTSFCPNLVKDTPTNRELVERIKYIYRQIKDYTDAREKDMWSLRHKLEK